MVCDLEFDSCPPWRPKDVFRSKSGENAPETPDVESEVGPGVIAWGPSLVKPALNEPDTATMFKAWQEHFGKAPFRTDLNTILNLHDDLTSEAHNLVARKGRDYNRTEQEGGDTLANLKVAAKLGLVETPAHGVLVRLMDKIMRLKSLCKPGEKPANADEKVKDTVVDVINYAIYVYALHLEAEFEHCAPVDDDQDDDEPVDHVDELLRTLEKLGVAREDWKDTLGYAVDRLRTMQEGGE